MKAVPLCSQNTIEFTAALPFSQHSPQRRESPNRWCNERNTCWVNAPRNNYAQWPIAGSRSAHSSSSIDQNDTITAVLIGLRDDM
jgi:hypothetical protein